MKYGRLGLGKTAELTYFELLNGGIKVTTTIGDKEVDVIYNNPSEELMNSQGWYRVETKQEDGIDYLEGNVIYHYVGQPYTYVPTKKEIKVKELNSLLDNKNELWEALERIVAQIGVTEEDRNMAQLRIDARYQLDELGKIVQTQEGTGDAFDPIKYWEDGMEVESGKWYQCYNSEGYIWEAIANGVPESDTDTNYFDVVL